MGWRGATSFALPLLQQLPFVRVLVEKALELLFTADVYNFAGIKHYISNVISVNRLLTIKNYSVLRNIVSIDARRGVYVS